MVETLIAKLRGLAGFTEPEKEELEDTAKKYLGNRKPAVIK